MERKEIDRYANANKSLPKYATHEEKLYWLVVNHVYALCKLRRYDIDKCRQIKSDMIREFDKFMQKVRPSEPELKAYAAAVKMRSELDRLTAPRARVKDMSKEELFELFMRIEGIITGAMQEADGEIPDFLKFR